MSLPVEIIQSYLLKIDIFNNDGCLTKHTKIQKPLF